MIEWGNVNIACNTETAATQFNTRINTVAGIGDLMYTILYFPIEGFFIGSFDKLVDNALWNAIFNLYQGF